MYLPQKREDGRLKAADSGPRLAAAVLDLFTLKGVFFVLGSIIPLLGNALFGAVGSAIEDNVFGPGRSVGRRMTRTRLIKEDGSVAEHPLVIKRNVINIAMLFLLVPFFVDMCLIMFGQGRRLSDMICGTVVVAYPSTDEDAAQYV
jgi:uncharacterized RDD family membrane protein YckC